MAGKTQMKINKYFQKVLVDYVYKYTYMNVLN